VVFSGCQQRNAQIRLMPVRRRAREMIDKWRK
jgi:hypothetical protein